ncbi:MAG: TRAP transporter substrate-binding protein [Rhodospirillales bacterium]|nr:TRAP transporter substrate-binding protein [Rhodospirillales bacterium]MCW8862507.1 TRAP transporter substrate-binding protein [Rhodospirillales bacterium]MCW8952542.1 TRAP transporter substrate-binding protein [Rhodospirillales bacterium]MCW8970113.1 TRAP transporter substrate-binding protein [Rhodospirillales bacterium]MCW9001451.1 TRAP transporter substrate-binding protein [Rhodospirillales bacterium]
MTHIRKLILSAIVAPVLAYGSSAMAETWNMPTPYPDANFHTQNIKTFAAEVKAATGGKLDIVVHGGGSLVKHPEIKNAVRTGQVPIGEFFLSRLSNENAVFGVDSLPFLATDYDAARKLWAASRPKINELLNKQRLMVLYSVPWPPQGLYTKKPVKTGNDLKGLKMRAYNALTEQLAQNVGAVPTQVEVPDIPQAFATGQVEAMITSPSTGANSKAWDFVSHYYDVQAWLPKNIVVVNKAAFDALDKATQNAVLAAAKSAETRGWTASMTETASKTKILKDNGMTVEAPSSELKGTLAKAGKTMVEGWKAKGGADAQAVLDAFNK